ncbi:hypothetical protein Dimus_016901 [Dionaea muscipula]
METERNDAELAANGTTMEEGENNGTGVEEEDTTREEADETRMEERENNKDMEIAPALIAVHPFYKSIAVAVGSDLRVFDLQGNSSVRLRDDDSKELLHKDSIRAVCFSGGGKILVSAGDDKLVKIWDADTWRCLGTVTTEKRVSAVAISRDELFVCFADKFGVVSVVSLEELNENVPLSNKKAVTILSHYCSIITSLEFSPDGRFIVSADRDFKIRVTVFPKNPLAGAHEIQSFCLGHSEYVSSLAFPQPDQSQNFLLSGSGDSTVRLWDIISGSLICTCHVGAKAGLSMESHPAVIDLCVAPKSSLVAVAIQGLQGVLLLTCDLSAKALSVIKVVSFSGETFIPTRLGTSSVAVAELLWMVSGVSSLPDFKASCLAQVKVASGFKKTVEEEEDERSSDHNVHELLTLLEDGDIPGGEKLLEELQGSVHIESNVISAAADAVRAAMSNLLVKKQYTVEKRDFRKRRRNDRKFKKR